MGKEIILLKSNGANTSTDSKHSHGVSLANSAFFLEYSLQYGVQ